MTLRWLITFSFSSFLSPGKNSCCGAVCLVSTATDCDVLSPCCSHSTASALCCASKKSHDFWWISCFFLYRSFGSVERSCWKSPNAIGSIESSCTFERNGRQHHDDLLHDWFNGRINGWLRVWKHAWTSHRVSLPPISLRSEKTQRDRNHDDPSYHDDNSACANINLSHHVHIHPNDDGWPNGSHDTRKLSKLYKLSQQHVTQWKLNQKYSVTFNVNLKLNVHKYFLITKRHKRNREIVEE